MRDLTFKTALTTALAGASGAAQACGFVSTDGGLASLICIDDPLGILIVAVLIGGVCALIPNLRRPPSAPKSTAG